jgi:hypothetical protein
MRIKNTTAGFGRARRLLFLIAFLWQCVCASFANEVGKPARAQEPTAEGTRCGNSHLPTMRLEGNTNTLTVHGERKIEKDEKEENFRRVERQYGSFTRSFTLPSSVDPGQVRADYNKGLLKIRLAKKAEAKPKQIKVNVDGEKRLEAKGPEAKAPGKAA